MPLSHTKYIVYITLVDLTHPRTLCTTNKNEKKKTISAENLKSLAKQIYSNIMQCWRAAARHIDQRSTTSRMDALELESVNCIENRRFGVSILLSTFSPFYTWYPAMAEGAHAAGIPFRILHSAPTNPHTLTLTRHTSLTFCRLLVLTFVLVGVAGNANTGEWRNHHRIYTAGMHTALGARCLHYIR